MKISASLDCADYMWLGRSIQILERAGIDWLHVDIMDGQFVPNLAIGTRLLRALDQVTTLPIELHLMVSDPERLLHLSAFPHVARITVHVEAVSRPYHLIDLVHTRDGQVGFALNPATPVSTIESLLPYLDQVVVMAVDPGFPGQRFIPEVLPKVQQIANLIRQAGLAIDLEVDGAISYSLLPLLKAAGVTTIVGGTSALFIPGEELDQAAGRLVAACRQGADAVRAEIAWADRGQA